MTVDVTILDLTILDLQLIQCAPIRFAVRFFTGGFGLRRFANTVAFAVAMRVRRQIQQNIFPQKRRQIDRLRSAQLRMQSERRHRNLIYKFFETGDAPQFHCLLE